MSRQYASEPERLMRRFKSAAQVQHVLEVSMRPHTIHPGFNAFVSRRSIVDSFGSERSPPGRLRRVFTEQEPSTEVRIRICLAKQLDNSPRGRAAR